MAEIGKNYILGRGEELTQGIAAPLSGASKKVPYSFAESKVRITKNLSNTVQQIDNLPSDARPNDQSVIALTLHPEYIAKSYYPTALLDSLGMKAVGSKGVMVKPEKWTKKAAPKETRSLTLFARGSVDAIRNIATKVNSLQEDSAAGQDVIKIESIEPITSITRSAPIKKQKDTIKLEVVLHASSEKDDAYVIEQFGKYAEHHGAKAEIDRKIFAQGLCFIPVEASTDEISALEDYSFLRALREMPLMRDFLKSTQGARINYTLPTGKPVAPNLRVAVFDGGVPANTLTQPWVTSIDADIVKKYPAFSIGLQHGTAVSSALLFGTLIDGQTPDQPYCYIDHYRMYGRDTAGNQPDEFEVVQAIRDIVIKKGYKYINLSIGPKSAITDGDVSLWTSVLDELFATHNVLATIAGGNDGRADWKSGNARVQPPADTVNGLAVGSSDVSLGSWKRADYSCIGPGRIPGIIKPDILSFGGSDSEKYKLIDAFNDSNTLEWSGTSFASPNSMRTAMGVQAYFGEILEPISLKALLIHHADTNGISKREVGWGRIPSDFRELMTSDDTTYKVVYQGKLSPASWLRVPVPMPNIGDMRGKVNIKATITYFTATDPQDAYNYTKAGIEVRFRPHDDKRTNPTDTYAKTKSFFQKSPLELFDDPLTHNAHFWETVLCSSKNFLSQSLQEPVFDIHYNARSGGAKAPKGTADINYAIVITVSAPKTAHLYDKVVGRYPILVPIRPQIEIPITT